MAIGSKIVSWFREKENVIYIEYSILALAVLLPLLKPGYILLLDMIATPKVRMPMEVSNSYLFGTALYLVNYILPSQIIEKLLMFVVLLFSFVGMHRLVPTKSEWPKYFAAILYVFNPFVYSRFMFGHIGLLLAYAAAPFLAKTILDFLDEPGLRKAVLIAILATLMAMVSPHHIVFAALIGGIAFIVFALFSLRDRRRILRIAGFVLLIVLIFLTLNSFWLVSFSKGESSQAQVMSRFGRQQIIGFQTMADKRLGVLFNTAAMYGFWGDEDRRYVLQKNIVPGWDIIFVVLFVIIAWGAVVGIRGKEKRWRAITFLVVGVISFVVAVGVAHPWFAPIFWFLDKYIPFFKGFRDSQKFVALLILSYGYLGALGMENVLELLKRVKKIPSWIIMIAPTFFLILPLLYSPLMLWGFGGQIKPVDYPKDWYQTNVMLNRDKDDFKVLFLPWHQYMGFNFAGRVIVNPADNFFDKPVIRGDNIEFGKIYRQVRNPTSEYIEKNIIRLKSPKAIRDVGKKLRPLKVKYVILAKEADYKLYWFLGDQRDLKLIRESETLKIYLNKDFR